MHSYRERMVKFQHENCHLKYDNHEYYGRFRTLTRLVIQFEFNYIIHCRKLISRRVIMNRNSRK